MGIGAPTKAQFIFAWINSIESIFLLIMEKDHKNLDEFHHF